MARRVYRLRDGVRILYGDTWYPGRIEAVDGQLYTISYDGYGDSWNETVGPDRLKPEPQRAAPGTLVAGSAVWIKWGGSWYRGQILRVTKTGYKITYDGFGSNWDEVVPRSRIKTIKAAKGTKLDGKRATAMTHGGPRRRTRQSQARTRRAKK
jgi:hypothetical protein